MSTESDLASAGSGTDLIHGDVPAVTNSSTTLGKWAVTLGEAAAGLGKLDATHWKGASAEAFRAKFDPQPTKWRDSAQAFTDAANACSEYGSALSAGQGTAQAALETYRAGVAATNAAKSAYDQHVKDLQTQAQSGGNRAPIIPNFVDPGQAQRDAAVAQLEQARSMVSAAADRAASTVREATENAPPKPSFWDKVEDFVVGTAAEVAVWGKELAVDAYNYVLVPTVNGILTFGNSLAHNPSDLVSIVAGALLIEVSAGGEAGGAILDATGFGALLGVPVGAISTAGIVTGVGLIGAGATDAISKMPDNQIQIVQMAGKSKPARMKDPGYGATPTRGAGDPPPPDGAAPYDPNVAGKVPEWGTSDVKTRGIIVKEDGSETAYQSGRQGPASEPGVGGPGSGLNGNVKTHVEAHAGYSLQPGEDGTLYLNRLPCDPANGQGCAQLLSKYVPEGSTLTVYGPDGFVAVIRGVRP